jgi:steroid 5-alpha reductase family enzyme
MLTVLSLVLIFGVVLQTSLWLIAEKKREADICDFGWVLVVAFSSIATAINFPFDRVVILMLLVLLWGFRLGRVILLRSWTAGEDKRYLAIREKVGSHASKVFFGLFQLQVVFALIITLSFISVGTKFSADIEASDILGIAVFIIGILGETIADRQLAQFKRSDQSKGVCKVGLWRYSRHPNYFFEWIIWCSLPILAWGSNLYVLSFAAPLLMLYLLLFVTGVPPAEASSINSRGEKFKTYQKETSAFFLWFPRSI